MKNILNFILLVSLISTFISCNKSNLTDKDYYIIDKKHNLSRDRILFIKHYKTNTKFIFNDSDILKEEYDVTLYTYDIKKNK